MARPVSPPRRAGPRHCYEGFVEKRGPRDQGYRRVWAGLQGLTLAFYGAPRDQQPLEVLDLSELAAARAEGGCLVLRLRDREVMLKAESAEAQEMWRGFILTMAEMKVPADLVLLPGHIFQLSEALREERDRRTTLGPTEPPVPLMPSCFFKVSRGEAEQLLERNAGSGNIVLRPGGHGHGISVTTCQMLNGTALFKHYKVVSVGQGYQIDVDTPHYCSSLAEVVQYFVEKSKGSLRPLHLEYSLKLEFVETDSENGETTRGACKPPPHLSAPQRAPVPQPRRLRAPILPAPRAPAPRRPMLQPPEGPGQQPCMNKQGDSTPPSSAHHPAAPQALLLPHGYADDITEELAQKLKVRRALTDD